MTRLERSSTQYKTAASMLDLYTFQVPSLTDTQTFGPHPQMLSTKAIAWTLSRKLGSEELPGLRKCFGDALDLRLCLVLHIPQPFLCNPDHLGGMRLGFGAAGLKAMNVHWLRVWCVNVPFYAICIHLAIAGCGKERTIGVNPCAHPAASR